MDLMTAMRSRHSVRRYVNKPIPAGGSYDTVDLGIVKYHFEVGAGKENFTWA